MVDQIRSCFHRKGEPISRSKIKAVTALRAPVSSPQSPENALISLLLAGFSDLISKTFHLFI
jgi:hypothetical protein